MTNISRRDFLAASFGLVATGALAACGGGSSSSAAASAADASATSSAAADAAASKVLTIAATPEPHAKILTEFAAPALAEKGIELQVKEFTDYVQPNEVVWNGEIDANYFQHVAYLNDYNEKNGESLVVVAKAHYEPYGIYAGKSSDLANIADGAEIAVPNDPSNEARALLLLQQAGLITLKNPDDIAATPNDIVDNPHNIKFREIEAAATPRALQDVDFAAVNGNYAIEAGLHASDALVVEKASDAVLDQYANIIATRPELASDERLLALAEVLASADFAAYLEKNFGQDVLPVK